MIHFSRILLADAAFIIFISFHVKAADQMTAGELKTAIDSVTHTFASDARLAIVASTDVDTAGRSTLWSYVYFSLDSGREYDLHIASGTIIFDSACSIRIGVGILNDQWIDSDSALSIAERSGGADIRTGYPTCTITASLYRPIHHNFTSCY
jgi:hypothetical protein